ncbi:hypothetical protein [Aquipuribacter sp. SD81]|uniref:hypothetical protein n=1 Tax=Aquipuribacter sp. SD81 TaxID=3127703 RepID=UPI00301B1311
MSPAPAGTGRTVSGLVPRLVLVLAAALGAAAQVAGRDWPGGSPLPALLPVLLALAVAWRPSLPLATPVVLGLGLLAVLAGGGLDARDALSLLAVHATHLAASLSAVLPRGARLEVAAVRATWRRSVLVQAVGQGVLLVGAAVG